MIDKTISHFKIIEKIGTGGMVDICKVRNFPGSALQRLAEEFRIPTVFAGTLEVTS